MKYGAVIVRAQRLYPRSSEIKNQFFFQYDSVSKKPIARDMDVGSKHQVFYLCFLTIKNTSINRSEKLYIINTLYNVFLSAHNETRLHTNTHALIERHTNRDNAIY